MWNAHRTSLAAIAAALGATGAGEQTLEEAAHHYLRSGRSYEFRAALGRLFESDPDSREDHLSAGSACVAGVNAVTSARWFSTFVTSTIVLACVVQGLDVNDKIDGSERSALDLTEIAICAVFALEAALKIAACGSAPQRYFGDSWNLFDFCVVVTTVATYLPGMHEVPAVSMLRLVRLIKVVRAYPALHVAVQSLLRAFKQVFWVAIIFTLMNFNLAVIGMQLFRANDPGRFGTLAAAMVTIWGVETGDAWDSVLYANMYGCARVGYEAGGRACANSEAYGWIAAAFFVSVVFLGGMILPTVLIGVISIAFEASTEAMREDRGRRAIVDAVRDRALTWDGGERVTAEIKALESAFGHLAHEQFEADPLAYESAEAVAAAGLDEEVMRAVSLFVIDRHAYWLEPATVAMMRHALDEGRGGTCTLPRFLFFFLFCAKLAIDADASDSFADSNLEERGVEEKETERLERYAPLVRIEMPPLRAPAAPSPPDLPRPSWLPAGGIEALLCASDRETPTERRRPTFFDGLPGEFICGQRAPPPRVAPSDSSTATI